jgi:hypothetical protein
MQKNVASQKFVVFAFNRTNNNPVTGDAANITANIRKDYGAAVATNDVNPTEQEDGYYVFDATQAETNADAIQIFPESTTADVQVILVGGIIYTTPANFGDDVIQTQDHTAAIADVPTVAEFNARTLAAADYFDPATDAVANVTTVTTTTNLANLPTIPSNWITAAGVAASALDNKGNWNVGKTGYSLVQSFPANFGDLSITASTGLVDITQAAADKVWSTATKELTSGNNIVLAKGVGVTGFNDIAATSIVSGGAINTTGGAVDNVTLTATTTSVTNEVNANTVKINGVTVIGNGTGGNLWRA